MAKIATKYYQIHPWKIIEEDFNPSRAQVSESIFSLANEYMGVRGFFEEGYSGKSLIGTYFNGIYEIPVEAPREGYKGISKKMHFMVNSVNFLATRIKINGKLLDLGKCNFRNFKRELDLKTGELIRSFIYQDQDTEVEFKFNRILDMTEYTNAYQKIQITPLSRDVEIELTSYFDYEIKHWGKFQYWEIEDSFLISPRNTVIAKTKQTNLRIISDFAIQNSLNLEGVNFEDGQKVGKIFSFNLQKNQVFDFEKQTLHIVSKDSKETPERLLSRMIPYLSRRTSYHDAYENNVKYYETMWKESDIEIVGDDENQQGIRYCIFQLMQTYQGAIPTDNIGAKGLTGEAYSGHAFWDTETYCLPFYLFHNLQAAKSLLMFRYNTLEAAKLRAKELDCIGACYPIATLNGNEGCDLWQHASLQFQPTTAVAYGIYHYEKLTNDLDFLYNYGAEMLLETSRFLASRGDWNQARTHFGFYGVMGPDEFQMMVNHNTYTNYMAKRTFEYTLEVLNKFKNDNKTLYEAFVKKTNLLEQELIDLKEKALKMLILYNEETNLYEQHLGYYDLPHIDIDKIPVEEFPLYANWSYDRIYRNDMIKQPDVLMMMLLFNQSFTKEEKVANYEFYEPRTIHESSLSPSVHSILASEIGKDQEAYKFFGFATRMDLDDYNRNALEGLHMTSIAAAWMNIVYGFGGVRSDGDLLTINPTIPNIWKSYRFMIRYKNSLITVNVSQDEIKINVTEEVNIKVNDQIVTITDFLVLRK